MFQQTDRQTGPCSNRQTGPCSNRQTDRQTGPCSKRQTDRQTGPCSNRQTDRQTGPCSNRQTDRQTGPCSNRETKRIRGNTGIGKATALHLARKGARVVLACRNRTKADAETGSSDVVYMHLDLASFKSIRCFTETFLKAESRLDLLINNAGLVADGRTEDGFGIEFGVNHLGHFLLTRLLLERLKEAGGGRVITLSSMAHRWGHIDFEALAVDKHLGTGGYSWQFWQAYCNSKLCNNLFTHELAKRLRGTDVTCYSVHPGVVRTELSRYVGLWQKLIIEPIARLLFLEPEAGAQTTLHCALQEGIEHLSGSYFSFCAVQEVCARARDDAVARKLWEVSERLCGLS
uniref:Dehydrogenase/reductase SDR family member 13-like n=1 Tax=Scophthalmus maximus TaxID=52904 RepID=A0A8D3E163_SCOMX